RLFGPAAPTGVTNVTFTSIAFSNGLYVAGSAGTLAYSTNALTYKAVTNVSGLSDIITFTNGFIGVGSAGKIYTSSDAVSWTQRNSGTANNLNCITRGAGLLVAV